MSLITERNRRMKILTKEQFDKFLYEYYVNNYGEKQTDTWFEQPALNVWVFRRDDKIITLKSHILTGTVTVKTETVTLN